MALLFYRCANCIQGIKIVIFSLPSLLDVYVYRHSCYCLYLGFQLILGLLLVEIVSV